MTARGIAIGARRALGDIGRELRTETDRIRLRRGGGVDLALFHEFAPPPTGGGHQFLRALVAELERRGLDIEVNRISAGTRACLLNSFNFDFRRLRRLARDDVRFVHRVDGPIATYRGFDDGTDTRIADLNAAFAHATIVQSQFSLEAHRELGIDLVDPHLIPNTVDPAIFHPPPEREPLAGRRVRVIATSWSDNPNKGSDALAWLDSNLDHERYEVTFVGRSATPFSSIRMTGPLPTELVAAELRRNDVYLAPSRNDPCSNALLEALASGLPAVYRLSGGHPELVGDAGVPFDDPEDVAHALDLLVPEIDERRAEIRVTPLSDVADRYLEVLRA